MNNFQEVSRLLVVVRRESHQTPKHFEHLNVLIFASFGCCHFRLESQHQLRKATNTTFRFQSITLPAPCWCEMLTWSSGVDGGGVFRGCAQTCECCCAEASAGSRRRVVNGCYSVRLPRCIRNDFTQTHWLCLWEIWNFISCVSGAASDFNGICFLGTTVQRFNSQTSTAYLSVCVIIIVLNLNHLLVGLKSSDTRKFNMFFKWKCLLSPTKKETLK